MSEVGNSLPKAALVTGGSQRVGRAIVLSLVEAGYAVAVHYNRSKEPADALVQEIVAKGGTAVAVGGDLTDEAATRPLVAEAARSLGPLGVVINNASVFLKDDAATETREMWDAHFAVHARTPFVLTQELVKQLPEGAEGAVISMIDERVFNLQPYFMSYGVSKYALWGLTQMLARDLAPRVRVNAIGPGPTLQGPRQTPEDFAAQWRAMPLQRPVPLEEITNAVRFILDARSMTGQMIALDSGQHMCWSPVTGDHDQLE